MSRNKNALTVDVDICVLTAGRSEMLENCLNSIQKDLENFPHRAKVYLFDNGGGNIETVHPVVNSFDKIKTNKGFPFGANHVINMGRAPIAIFVSDDIVLRENFINSLYNTIKSDPKIGLCGAKLLFPPKSTDPFRPAGTVQHIGHAMDINANVIHPLVGWSETNPKCCISKEVFSVTGATFAVRRDVFNRVKGFDQIYGLGTFEDVDMALKIRQAGYKIWVDTNAVAYHYVGATAEIRKEAFPLEQNRMILLQKWMQTGFLVWDNWMYY